MGFLNVLYGTPIGLVLGLMGDGGSIVTIPVLVYLVGMNIHSAIGTGLVIVGSTALMGVIEYLRERFVEWRVTLIFVIFGILTNFLGSHFNMLMPRKALLYTFAATMVLIGVMMLKRSKKNDDDHSKISDYSKIKKWSLLIITASVVGFMTGFLGVGGGFLVVSSLALILGLPMKHAIATSLSIITFNCLWGILARVFTNVTIQFSPVLWILIGTAIGITVGRIIAIHMNNKSLRKAFAFFILSIAVYMFLRTIGFISVV